MSANCFSILCISAMPCGLMSMRRTEIANAMAQHLVLADQHLSFRLVKGAFVTATHHPVSAVSADRGGSESRGCAAAWGPGAAVEVGARHVKGASRVREARRAGVGANGW